MIPSTRTLTQRRDELRESFCRELMELAPSLAPRDVGRVAEWALEQCDMTSKVSERALEMALELQGKGGGHGSP